MNEEEAKKKILIGLWSRDLFASITVKTHTDLDDLLHDLQKLERISEQRNERIRQAKEIAKTKPDDGITERREKLGPNWEDNTNKPGKIAIDTNLDKRPPLWNDKGELKCFNRHNFGHISKDCPDSPKKLICTVCKAKGYIKSYCPQKKILLKDFGPDHFEVYSVGEFVARIIVDGVRAEDFPLYVVPDDYQSIDIFIGRTYTQLPHINYYKRGEELVFEEREDARIIKMNIGEKNQEVHFISAMRDDGKLCSSCYKFRYQRVYIY